MSSLVERLLGRSGAERAQARLRGFLSRLKPRAAAPPAPPRAARRRFALSLQPDRIYAIGDVHGCIEKLRALEAAIVADCEGFTGTKLLVCLGDYIDRGTDSAAVIAHLIAPAPEGFHRICLSGNHEEVLIDVLDGRLPLSAWLRLGGDDTLLSYGYDVDYMTRYRKMHGPELVEEFREALPETHVAFLRQLPSVFSTPQQIFVHAGLRPGVSFEDQTEDDFLWIRDSFLKDDVPSFGRLVVHGHTPAWEPFASPVRVNVDTGAYLGGPLTAVRIEAGRIRFLSVP